MNDSERRVSSGEAWAEFCDALKQAGEQIQRPDAPSDPFTRAEGYRYLSRLARAGLEWYLEFNDPAFPVLYVPSHETIKIGADNPDNLYQKAVLDGRHEYRIRGRRGTVYYLSFLTSKGSYAENFQADRDRISSTASSCNWNPTGASRSSSVPRKHAGNWLPMEPETIAAGPPDLHGPQGRNAGRAHDRTRWIAVRRRSL
jgi:hypothetical protein